nr:putative G-protein coupled receptor [Biomphalaria glabrata]
MKETNNNSLFAITVMHVQFGEFFLWSSESERLLLMILKCYINPVISIVGLAANSLGMIILWRSGLDKASNILLFGLTIADSCCMFFTINIAEMLLFFDPSKKFRNVAGWQHDRSTAFALYFLRSTFYFIAKFAGVSVVASFLFWLPISLVYEDLTPFNYVPISNGSQIGIWTVSEYYSQRLDIIILMFNYIFDFMSSWIPVGFIAVGCLAIWVKVKITIKRRRLLQASFQGLKTSTRTTRTLLATCLVFATTHALYSVLIYIFDIDFFLYQQNFLVYELMHLIYVINNSSNFFVYVAMDNKLWIICKHIIFKEAY